MENNENEQAAKELAEERAKLGFGPKPGSKGEHQNLDEDESEDMGDLEDEEEVEDEEDIDEDEDSEIEEDDDADDSEDDSDEDDSEDEDSDKEKSQKKRKISFTKFNQMRKDMRKAQKDLADAIAKNSELEAKLPDDFQERADALVKELGLENPDGVKKIMQFMKEFVVDKNTKKLEAKITELENMVKNNDTTPAVVDEFPKEWESFEKDFLSTEFPNATKEQIKDCKELMKKLSHTKGIGGKAYIDEKSGKEVLNPYPLDYILYKNREKFEELVTGKKSKGMETARSQGIYKKETTDGDIKHLPKNAPASDVRRLDKKYSQLESGAFESLRSPENSTI